MENVRKYIDIKPVKSKSKRNYLLSEANYNLTRFFFRKHFSHRNERKENTHTHTHTHIKIFINKFLYLGLSILQISITIMSAFCYDYVKPKYGVIAPTL